MSGFATFEMRIEHGYSNNADGFCLREKEDEETEGEVQALTVFVAPSVTPTKNCG